MTKRYTVTLVGLTINEVLTLSYEAERARETASPMMGITKKTLRLLKAERERAWKDYEVSKRNQKRKKGHGPKRKGKKRG